MSITPEIRRSNLPCGEQNRSGSSGEELDLVIDCEGRRRFLRVSHQRLSAGVRAIDVMDDPGNEGCRIYRAAS